jgi:hypothetical protein
VNGPIFIAGTDRAGKTLVSAVLSSHSRISVPAVGSNLWTLFYRRFGDDLSEPASLEQCLRELMLYKHVRFLDPDVERLRRDFSAGAPTYARLFALLQEQYAERSGKPRWGDQTGLIEGYAQPIFSAYPDARFVHMLRDPRDRYEASVSLWPDGRLRVGGAVARWLYSSHHAERNVERHRDRYCVVRYEDLVRSPEATIRDIWGFIGETYEPEMLELRGMPTYRAKLLGSADAPTPLGGVITDVHVGRYRGRIPARELRFMEWRAGSRMQRHGYELERPVLSGWNRMRFSVLDLPLNLARMAVWNARQAVAERFPTRFGRRPPRHHLVR